MITNNLKNRKIYIDILRIIACFLVIACHTNAWGFDKQVINTNWFLSVGYYLLTKTAVPIFFMISGALYLNKDYSYKQIFKKIGIRILIPMVLFSGIIYFRKNGEVSLENFKSFIWALCAGEISAHYWFLYTLIGLYLMTPFLRKMIKNFQKKDYYIFFAIWIITQGILPIIEHYTPLNITKEFSVQIVYGYIGYYILGHFVTNIIEITRKKKYIYSAIIVLILAIVGSTIVTYTDYIRNNLNNYSVFLDKLNFVTISIPVICIVYIVRYYFENLNYKIKIENCIVAISSTTFGIYLTHGMLLKKFELIYNFVNGFAYEFIAKITAQIVVFILMSIIIYVLKKMPYVKRII